MASAVDARLFSVCVFMIPFVIVPITMIVFTAHSRIHHTKWRRDYRAGGISRYADNRTGDRKRRLDSLNRGIHSHTYHGSNATRQQCR